MASIDPPPQPDAYIEALKIMFKELEMRTCC